MGATIGVINAIGIGESPNPDTDPYLRDLNGEHYQIVVALGFWKPGDGGGGVFYWHEGPIPRSVPMDGEVADVCMPGEPFLMEGGDGGTMIPGSADANLAYWKRLYSEAINVKWFGARGVSELDDVGAFTGDDSPYIQRALNAAVALGGGIVFFPRGQYQVRDTIRIPNRNPSYNAAAALCPVVLRGEGAAQAGPIRMRCANFDPVNDPEKDPGSMIRGSRDLPADAPIIEWETESAYWAWYHVIEGLSFFREQSGPILRYTSTDSRRPYFCVIRDCRFHANMLAGAERVPGVGHNIEIDRAYQCIIENVTVDGGAVGLVLTNAAHVLVRNFAVTTNIHSRFA